MTEHGNCPACQADLNGGSIWQTFYDKFTTEGYWMDDEGKYSKDLRILEPAEAEKVADEVSSNYGATRTKGLWGRAIGIYNMDTDRTEVWRCPDCDHEWFR